jgi:hypothetical protein
MKGILEQQVDGDYIYRVRDRRRNKADQMALKLKIKIALLIVAGIIIGAGFGSYATVQFIGFRLAELTK